MNKKIITFFAVLIILTFIGYMIFDSVRPEKSEGNNALTDKVETIPDSWQISGEIVINDGTLKAVAVSSAGDIYAGGDSFINRYDKNLNLIWNLKTPYPVTSLTLSGDTIFAGTMELILIVSTDSKIKNEWGPYDDKSIITSVSSNNTYIVFADAGNKMLYILDKGGEVIYMIGQNDGQFIVPSPYFDVALTGDNMLFVANTGHRRVETRSIDGDLLSYFGEPGTAPDAFCGCCNPAHFAVIPQGFVTAEKGINRIKILNNKGEFVEYVSAKNNFPASIPLDLASSDGKTIYAANSSDSKLYIFTHN